jgi:hypothetical protein
VNGEGQRQSGVHVGIICVAIVHAKHEVVLELAQREQDGPEQGGLHPAIATAVMIIRRFVSILAEAGYILRLIARIEARLSRLYRRHYRIIAPQLPPLGRRKEIRRVRVA